MSEGSDADAAHVASQRFQSFFSALHAKELPLVVGACRLRASRAWLRKAMILATRGGDGWALALIVPLGFWLEPVRSQVSLVAGVLSGLGTALVVHGIKTLVRRQRPVAEGLTPPIDAPDRWAFPSGHTAHSFSVVVILLWLHPLIGLAMLPFSVSVGLSRIFLGLHYPSDVGIGALLGSSFAAGLLGLFALNGWSDAIMRMGPLG